MSLCKYISISVFIFFLAVHQCVSVIYWRNVKKEQNKTDAVARCVQSSEFRGQSSEVRGQRSGDGDVVYDLHTAALTDVFLMQL